MYCIICDRKISKKNFNIYKICHKCFFHINSLKINYTYFYSLKNKNNFKEKITCKIIYKYSGLIKELIYRYKFKKEIKLSSILSKLFISEINSFTDKNNFSYIVPAPFHYLRLLKTGFLPNNYLCFLISKKIKINYHECLKKNLFPIRAQKFLNKDKRLKAKNNIICTKDLTNKKILLIDDILTSGQTISNSIETLVKSNAKKISTIIFALS